jgi:hypothetical protein
VNDAKDVFNILNMIDKLSGHATLIAKGGTGGCRLPIDKTTGISRAFAPLTTDLSAIRPWQKYKSPRSPGGQT